MTLAILQNNSPVVTMTSQEIADLVESTKGEYKAHLAARRKVYNAQRRLDTACRKVSV